MTKDAIEVFYDVSIRGKGGVLVLFSKNHKTLKDAEDWAKRHAVTCGRYEIICVERMLFSKGKF